MAINADAQTTRMLRHNADKGWETILMCSVEHY